MKSTDSRGFSRTDDRCDRCGAEAMYAAVHEHYTELLFCRHHFTAHSSALLQQGWTFIENTPQETVDKALTPTF